MEIKVVRSPDRKKTIQAKMVKDTLFIYIPAGLHREEESKLIEKMKQKIEQKVLKTQANKDDYLKKRFDEFNRTFFGEKLVVNSIVFVTNQEKVRGSCTPAKGTIRISHRLLDMPKWVLDYVIFHEMTHLVHPDHSSAFWEKVARFKYTERARGFLMAKGMEDEETGNIGG
ncbi:MAG: M48 family metallopeptidase [Euryarchaeota archaeon]|nr:M48 family metallopeptidase [Euryarchaeota archaeon]